MTVVCPYCKQAAKCVDSREIYGRSYGYAYLCKPCDAWVGCHKGTRRPLGRLANKTLRELKMQAHAAFDPLWKNTATMTREGAYKWLTQSLGIDRSACHIGMFDEDQCKRVIELCGDAKQLAGG